MVKFHPPFGWSKGGSWHPTCFNVWTYEIENIQLRVVDCRKKDSKPMNILINNQPAQLREDDPVGDAASLCRSKMIHSWFSFGQPPHPRMVSCGVRDPLWKSDELRSRPKKHQDETPMLISPPAHLKVGTFYAFLSPPFLPCFAKRRVKKLGWPSSPLPQHKLGFPKFAPPSCGGNKWYALKGCFFGPKKTTQQNGDWSQDCRSGQQLFEWGYIYTVYIYIPDKVFFHPQWNALIDHLQGLRLQ